MKSFSRVTQLGSRTPSQVCGSPKMVSRTQEEAASGYQPFFSPFMVLPFSPALRGEGELQPGGFNYKGHWHRSD